VAVAVAVAVAVPVTVDERVAGNKKQHPPHDHNNIYGTVRCVASGIPGTHCHGTVESYGTLTVGNSDLLYQKLENSIFLP
jgi:hypothetical protein